MFLRLITAAAITFCVPLASLCRAEAGPGLPLIVSPLPSDIRQGDIIPVKVSASMEIQSLQGTFDGKEIYFAKTEGGKEFIGVLGIDMTFSPGRSLLLIEGNVEGGKITESVEFDVKKRSYVVEELALPEKMVELDKESEERADREAEKLRIIWGKTSLDKLWDGNFAVPVNGKLNANFGKRRVLNGKEKSPHNGIDIGAPEGKEILSPNGGKVVLVDNQFFGGNTIVLDHGLGLYTAYLHLSEVLVKEGDIVRRGDLIGRVGETGRSKGPHLHWTARVNDARIDPLKLLEFENKEIMHGEARK